MSVGRVFPFKERMRFTVRMNFTNVSQPAEMSNPIRLAVDGGYDGNVQGVPLHAVNVLTGGFGFINFAGGATFLPARQGTLEMRLSF